MGRNKHGLSRHIPKAVKEQVRELCGFGCIICGGIPYDYDHFETEFHECTEHSVNNIVLLCDKHHREKGSIGVGVIKEYLTKVSLDGRDVTFDPSILTDEFKIIWPSITIGSAEHNILIDGEEILRISKTGNTLNPIHLNGVFYDDEGTKICSIKENQITAHQNELGDIECVNFRFKMTAKSGNSILTFRMEPRQLIIEEIFLVKNSAFVIADQSRFIVGNGDHYGDFTNAVMHGNRHGVILHSGVKSLRFIDRNLYLPE